MSKKSDPRGKQPGKQQKKITQSTPTRAEILEKCRISKRKSGEQDQEGGNNEQIKRRQVNGG